jgi:tetratricopeptide (TPR) repeat protein
MKTPHNFAALRAIAEGIRDEQRRARPIVERLVTTIGQQWDEEIPSEWRNVGFVQELNKMSASTLEQNAGTSHELAQFALAVATSIPRDEYPSLILAQIEGTAWRRIAQAHHYRSNYADALRALDAADRCLWTENGLFEERALAGFVRAMIYADLLRFDDADLLLCESEEVFDTLGDVRLYGHCLLLRAMIAYRQHRLVPAADIFREATDVLREAATYDNSRRRSMASASSKTISENRRLRQARSRMRSRSSLTSASPVKSRGRKVLSGASPSLSADMQKHESYSRKPAAFF